MASTARKQSWMLVLGLLSLFYSVQDSSRNSSTHSYEPDLDNHSQAAQKRNLDNHSQVEANLI